MIVGIVALPISIQSFTTGPVVGILLSLRLGHSSKPVRLVLDSLTNLGVRHDVHRHAIHADGEIVLAGSTGLRNTAGKSSATL